MRINRINLTPSDRLLEMIEQVMEEKGIKKRTQATEFMMITGYEKLFPAYVRMTEITKKTQSLSPTEQAQRSEEKAKARTKIKNDMRAEAFRNTCEIDLNGRVDDSSGQLMCHYNVYDRSRVFPQEVPLDQLNQDLVQRQYLPNREAVEAIQAKAKTK